MEEGALRSYKSYPEPHLLRKVQENDFTQKSAIGKYASQIHTKLLSEEENKERKSIPADNESMPERYALKID